MLIGRPCLTAVCPALGLLVVGCGSAGDAATGLALTGEFNGGLQTNRPIFCTTDQKYEFSYRFVGTVDGHIVEVWLLLQAPNPPRDMISGDNAISIPSGLPVATADPSGVYPGDELLRSLGPRNLATLVDDLTTERHYLAGNFHIDAGWRSGWMTLGDSRVRLDGRWRCP